MLEPIFTRTSKRNNANFSHIVKGKNMSVTMKPIDFTIDKQVTFFRGDYILFATLEHDGDAQNPCDDGNFTVYSLGRNHLNSIGLERANELLEEHGKRAFRLSYFEHGSCVWSLQGQGPQCEFDSVSFAGVLVIEGDDDFDFESYAKSALEEYTSWCNGDVYGYTIKAYKLLRDSDGDAISSASHYESKEAFVDDSVWNFIGNDYVQEAINEALEYALDSCSSATIR